MSAQAFLTSAVLTEIERERTLQLNSDPDDFLSVLFPITSENTDNVRWHIRDNVTGGTPSVPVGDNLPIFGSPGAKEFALIPGHFGEGRRISADKLVSGGAMGTLGQVIDADKEVGILQLELAYREHTTMNIIRGTLLSSGVVTIADKDGALKEQARWDGWSARFLDISGTAAAWNNFATSTPLLSIRSWYDPYFKGSGHEYSPRALMGATRSTWFNMLNCTNAADIGGKRDRFGATIDGLSAFTDKYSVNGELPTAKMVQGDYLTSLGAVTTFLPDGYVAIAGYNKQYGNSVGDYVFTRNPELIAASLGGGDPALGGLSPSGVYAETDFETAPPKLPRTWRSHSGGVRVRYQKQLLIVRVY